MKQKILYNVQDLLGNIRCILMLYWSCGKPSLKEPFKVGKVNRFNSSRLQTYERRAIFWTSLLQVCWLILRLSALQILIAIKIRAVYWLFHKLWLHDWKAMAVNVIESKLNAVFSSRARNLHVFALWTEITIAFAIKIFFSFNLQRLVFLFVLNVLFRSRTVCF